MTSKISYTKLILSDIRRRGWLAALSGAAFFLLMPVYSMLYLSTYTDSLRELIDYFPGLLNGNSMRYLAAAIGILSILSAVSGFSYLHSGIKLDFFHALPVRRTVWFATAYVSGLILVLVPYILCSALTLAVGAASGGMTAALALRCAQAVSGAILAFVIVYSACVFAVMLTGQTVTGLLMSLAVIVYPFVAFTLVNYLESSFFRSYYSYDTTSTLTYRLAEYLSPIGMFSSLITRSAWGLLSAGLIVGAVFMAALLIAAAALICRVYPSEAAGTPIAFPRLSPVFKVLLSIPAALFVSLMIQEMMMLFGNDWLFLLGLLTVLILCAAIDFIYTLDLKAIVKSWRSTLISVAGVLAVLCFFRFDVSGYDTYLPDEGKIESICFRPESFGSYFYYPDDISGNDSSQGYFASADATAALRALAQSGIDNMENGIDARNLHSGEIDEGSEQYISALFRYKLSGGRTVTRTYAVTYDDAADALDEMLKSDAYRKELFPIFHVDEDAVSAVWMSDAYFISDRLKLTKDQIQALLAAYKTDVMNVSADTLVNERPLGEFTLDIVSDDERNENQKTVVPDKTSVSYTAGAQYEPVTPSLFALYIYPGYTNTLALLGEYGYAPRAQIDPSDVSSLTWTVSQETMQSGAYAEFIAGLRDTEQSYADPGAAENAGAYDADNTDTYDAAADITVTSQEDIAAVLTFINAQPYNYGILSDTTRPDYLSVQYADGDSCSYAL